MNKQAFFPFIRSIADHFRGDYKRSEYDKMILPFTELRRLDCLLGGTKATVLAEYADKQKAELNSEPFLLREGGRASATNPILS
jgi:type I restriction enzyme M protein